MARIRRSMSLRMVDVTQVVFKGSVPTASTYEVVSVSENRAFRMFSESTPNPCPGRPAILASWVQVSFQAPRKIDRIKSGSPLSVNPFSIADLFSYDDTQVMFVVEAMLREGLVVDGVHFSRCLRSSSQTRSGDALFVATALDRDHVRHELCYGAKFGKLVDGVLVENIAKMESRYGLALSSTLDTYLAFGKELSFELRSDFIRDGINHTDGMGTIRPSAAVRVAMALEIITPKKGAYLLHIMHKVGFCAAMAQDPKFRTLWAQIPSAFQVRCAGMKGLQVVYPHDEMHGVDVDLVIGASQWKYTYDADNYSPTLEVCDWQKAPKSPYAMLNYQFIQSLAISPEQVIGLAKEALDRIESTILTQPSSAMAFLGMVTSSDEDEAIEHVSKVTRILDACPAMISDFYVQKKIRALLEKYVTEMRFGRIPVEGQYRFVAADPTLYFWSELGFDAPEEYQGMLAAGQNYLDGKVGEFCAMRSPMIHSSEVCLLDMVSVPLWSSMGLMQGLVVVNSHDDTDQRAGGMDKDGDRLFLTPNAVVRSCVAGGEVMVTEAREGTYGVISWESLIQYDMSTAGGSQVGYITNLATIKVDKALCEVQAMLQGRPEESLLLAHDALDVVVLSVGAAQVQCEDEVPF